jgi:hypothetical protein
MHLGIIFLLDLRQKKGGGGQLLKFCLLYCRLVIFNVKMIEVLLAEKK